MRPPLVPRRFWLPALVLGFALLAPALFRIESGLGPDPAGGRYLPPLTCAHEIPLRAGGTWIVTDLTESPDGWRARRGGSDVAIESGSVADAPRERLFLLGTDGIGRDMLGRLLEGTRHSLLVAGAAVLLAVFAGVIVGASAGLGGRRRDALLMRATDTLLAMPRLLLYLLCAALFGPSTWLVVLVVGLTTWPALARLVRASTRATRGSESVLAARAAGCSWPRLVWLHVLPAAAPVVAVTAALRFADTILLEASLSFLGLGSPPPAISLGGIIAAGRGVLADAWWISVGPGIAIGLLVLSVRMAAARIVGLSDPASVA